MCDWIDKVYGGNNALNHGQAESNQPLLVCHPATFDFSFIHWYCYEFLEKFPFFMAGVDMGSYASAVLKSDIRKSGKRDWPDQLKAKDFPHTHRAIDDATSHAIHFCRIVRKNLKL